MNSETQQDRQKNITIALVGFSALFIILRTPELLSNPRLWAEEGGWYVTRASFLFNRDDWYLMFFPTQFPYYAFWPMIVSYLAMVLVPIDQLPVVTTFMAFLIQMVPVMIIVTSRSDVWTNKWVRAAGCLIVVLAPISDETWLNTINSQFYLAIATFLILIDSAQASLGRRIFTLIVLGVAGLTGWVSVFMTPVFLWRSIRERGFRWHQFYTMSAGLIVQIIAISVVVITGDHALKSRFCSFDIPIFVCTIWTQCIGLLSFGLSGANAIIASLLTGDSSRVVSWSPQLVGLMLAEIAILYVCFISMPTHIRIPAMLSFGLVTTCSVASALGGMSWLVTNGGGHRYFIAPNTMLLLMFLWTFNTRVLQRSKRLFCWMFLVIGLCNSMIWFVTIGPNRVDRPIWKEEVSKWRKTPDYQLRICPDGWKISLYHHEYDRKRRQSHSPAIPRATRIPDMVRSNRL